MITENIIERMITDYYRNLDSNAAMEEFDSIINWDKFECVNGKETMYSREDYVLWYDDVKNSMFNKKHTIQKMRIMKTADGEHRAEIDMHFRADTWKRGEGKSREISVGADIIWLLKKCNESGEIKLESYTIYEK